jgi:hypothetical protein
MEVRPTAPSPNFDLKGRHGYVERRIRSVGAKSRWAAILLVTLVATAAYYGRDYLRIFAGGPKPYTTSALLALTSEERAKNPWVKVTGLDLETVATKRKSRGGNVSGAMTLHQNDETTQLLFVIIGSDKLPSEAIGMISAIPSDFSTRMRASKEGSQLFQAASRSVTIETRWDEIYLFPGLAVGAVLIALSIALVQWRRASRILNPSISPPLLKLMRFGPLQECLPVINTDLGSGAALRLGSATIGTDHIAIEGNANFEVMRISKLVWAYLEMTQHSYNGIPTGKTYKVVLSDAFGEQASIGLSKAKSDKLIELIATRNSSVLTTFSDELAAFWKANPQAAATAIQTRDKKA